MDAISQTTSDMQTPRQKRASQTLPDSHLKSSGQHLPVNSMGTFMNPESTVTAAASIAENICPQCRAECSRKSHELVSVRNSDLYEQYVQSNTSTNITNQNPNRTSGSQELLSRQTDSNPVVLLYLTSTSAHASSTPPSTPTSARHVSMSESKSTHSEKCIQPILITNPSINTVDNRLDFSVQTLTPGVEILAIKPSASMKDIKTNQTPCTLETCPKLNPIGLNDASKAEIQPTVIKNLMESSKSLSTQTSANESNVSGEIPTQTIITAVKLCKLNQQFRTLESLNPIDSNDASKTGIKPTVVSKMDTSKSLSTQTSANVSNVGVKTPTKLSKTLSDSKKESKINDSVCTLETCPKLNPIGSNNAASKMAIQPKEVPIIIELCKCVPTKKSLDASPASFKVVKHSKDLSVQTVQTVDTYSAQDGRYMDLNAVDNNYNDLPIASTPPSSGLNSLYAKQKSIKRGVGEAKLAIINASPMAIESTTRQSSTESSTVRLHSLMPHHDSQRDDHPVPSVRASLFSEKRVSSLDRGLFAHDVYQRATMNDANNTIKNEWKSLSNTSVESRNDLQFDRVLKEENENSSIKTKSQSLQSLPNLSSPLNRTKSHLDIPAILKPLKDCDCLADPRGITWFGIEYTDYRPRRFIKQDAWMVTNTLRERAPAMQAHQQLDINWGVPSKPYTASYPDYSGPGLNYWKIAKILNSEVSNRRAVLLQALRWRITKSAKTTCDAFIAELVLCDLLGLRGKCTTALRLEQLLWPLSQPQPSKITDAMARLLNALCSCAAGLDYVAAHSIVALLVWGEPLRGTQFRLRRDPIAETTAENLIGCMQKLAQHEAQRKDMLHKGVILWLLQHLYDIEKSASAYHIERALKLLRQLCTHRPFSRGDSTDFRHSLVMLARYLHSDLPECRAHIRAILLAMLQHPRLAAKAKVLRYDWMIEELRNVCPKDGPEYAEYGMILAVLRRTNRVMWRPLPMVHQLGANVAIDGVWDRQIDDNDPIVASGLNGEELLLRVFTLKTR